MRAPAPIRQPLPMTAWLRMIAPMPTRDPSPMVQPWSMARWPTETFLPRVRGMPGSACRTAASWMLVRSPMVMMSLSPRTTDLNQTLAWLCRITVPTTVALCAMNHSSPWNTTLRSPSENTAMLRPIISEAPRASAACYHHALHEAESVRVRPGPRPALPLPLLGRRARAEVLYAARLDGRVGFVPVPGGRAARQLARDRSGLARLRAHRVGEERQLLVSGLFRRPGVLARALPAGRSGDAHRPQHGRQRRSDVRRHPARARCALDQPGRVRTDCGTRREGARALRALARRARRREAGISRLRFLRRARRAPARQQFPFERRKGLVPRAALGKVEARRPRRARERSRAQTGQSGSLSSRGSRGLLAQSRIARALGRGRRIESARDAEDVARRSRRAQGVFPAIDRTRDRRRRPYGASRSTRAARGGDRGVSRVRCLIEYRSSFPLDRFRRSAQTRRARRAGRGERRGNARADRSRRGVRARRGACEGRIGRHSLHRRRRDFGDLGRKHGSYRRLTD